MGSLKSYVGSSQPDNSTGTSREFMSGAEQDYENPMFLKTLFKALVIVRTAFF